MIVRIVNLKMRPDKVEVFLDIFEKHKKSIRNASGCKYLELLHGVHDKSRITTYSQWSSEQDLNNYRNSELFGIVWPAIKACLKAPAEARSYSLAEKLI